MKHGTMRSILSICLVASLLGTTGCGAMFDLAYVVGRKRYDQSKEERKPTGQVNTAIEYESALTPDGQIRVSCEERERRIERTFYVSKVYEYRGGYTRSTYLTAAALSAAAGGLVAGIVAIGCNLPPQPGETDVKRWSCINALYATPFAADLGWSLIRAATAKPPKLVDKHKNEGPLAFGEVPTRSAAVSCDSIERVALGSVTGASDVELLNGRESAEPQRLRDDAIPVALGEGGSIQLATQPEVVQAWVRNPALEFWVVNREGKPRPLRVDRCGALRPVFLTIPPADQSMFLQQCPPPNAAPTR